MEDPCPLGKHLVAFDFTSVCSGGGPRTGPPRPVTADACVSTSTLSSLFTTIDAVFICGGRSCDTPPLYWICTQLLRRAERWSEAAGRGLRSCFRIGAPPNWMGRPVARRVPSARWLTADRPSMSSQEKRAEPFPPGILWSLCGRSPCGRRQIRSFVHRSPHLDVIRAKVSSGRRVPFDTTRRRGRPQSAAGHGALPTAAAVVTKGALCTRPDKPGCSG